MVLGQHYNTRAALIQLYFQLMEFQEERTQLQEEIKRLQKEVANKEKYASLQKNINQNIEKRESNNKKKITELEDKNKQLQAKLAAIADKSTAIQPDFDRDNEIRDSYESKIRQLEVNKEKLLEEIQQLKCSELKQKQENKQLSEKVEKLQSQLFQQSAILKGQEQSYDFDMPSLIEKSMNLQKKSKKERENQTKQTQGSIFIKKQAEEKSIHKDGQGNEPSEADSLPQKPNMNEFEEPSEVLEKKRDIKILDEEYELPLKVQPPHKKIMNQIRNHYESMQYNKKWAFLNMIYSWSEGKMDKICQAIQQMQHD